MDKNKKLQVGVDFTKQPELYKALVEMAERQASTPPRLIRRFVAEGMEVYTHVESLGAMVLPKIKAASRKVQS